MPRSTRKVAVVHPEPKHGKLLSQERAMDVWFAHAVQSLVDHAQQKSLGGAKLTSAGCKKMRQRQIGEVRNRLAALSTSSDTLGVSFAGAAFQEKYFATKFQRRGTLLYEVLCDLSLTFLDSTMINVASFGGGPGTDASGLVWWQQDMHPAIVFQCILYDREPTWKRYLQVLSRLFQSAGRVALSFAPCDVTLCLGDEKNSKVDVTDADLLLFFYVCHETSIASAASQHCFYVDLARAAKRGAVVIIADVMKHSQTALQEVFAAMSKVRSLELLRMKKDHSACVHAFRIV
jgi:hypothetical protein